MAYLDCGKNQLSAISLKSCTALTYLGCAQNSLTSLDASASTALKELYCGYNSLSGTLDLSVNKQLTTVDCKGNSSLTKLILYKSNSVKNLSKDAQTALVLN